MLENEMKISLTLVAFDKMSKVLRDAVHSSNSEFDKMQNKIQSLSSNLENIGKVATIVGGSLTAIGAANLKLAGDFSAGMTNVATLIDTNVENFDAIVECRNFTIVDSFCASLIIVGWMRRTQNLNQWILLIKH